MKLVYDLKGLRRNRSGSRHRRGVRKRDVLKINVHRINVNAKVSCVAQLRLVYIKLSIQSYMY